MKAILYNAVDNSLKRSKNSYERRQKQYFRKREGFENGYG